jgi:hypothetical protein
MHSLTHSLTAPLSHSLTRSRDKLHYHPLTHSCILSPCSPTHQFTQSFSRSYPIRPSNQSMTLTCSSVHPFKQALIYSLALSLTYVFIHPHPHLPIHSRSFVFTHSPNQFVNREATHPFTDPLYLPLTLAGSLILASTHPAAHSFIPSTTHTISLSLTYPYIFSHLPTYLLIQSVTHSPAHTSTHIPLRTSLSLPFPYGITHQTDQSINAAPRTHTPTSSRGHSLP